MAGVVRRDGLREAVTELRAVSFWDAEESQPPAVREMSIGPASTKDVEEFAHRYHYTRLGNSAVWRWGLWHREVLWGVVSYNLPTKRTCASVFGPEHAEHVWHMGRLILADHAPKNSESRLIGGSLRRIRDEHPHVWAVLTYAATDAGHIGYVYQATNALYTGVGGDSAYHVDADGGRHGTYLRGRRVSPDRAVGLGWTRVAGGPKHRYLYLLGSKSQRRRRLALLRLPILPYPKSAECAS